MEKSAIDIITLKCSRLRVQTTANRTRVMRIYEILEKKNIILRIVLSTCILIRISYAKNFFFSPTVLHYYKQISPILL